ncbi:AAA family ATPase [Proteocatella sphenisci]|uniref:AAA family ATPase n=1 Tax=Proteocatella sphenisci TaxID=181070 RepID=UPI00048E7C8B|nr:AAA family ATPase [Proteocatella sphenisci]
MTKELKLINMEDVEVKAVEWLWYPYIPYGKITILQSDPGTGKTTLMLQLAAWLSKGEALPLLNEESTPINIIYQTAEDGLEDTIKPRLLKSGADCSRILVIDESEAELTMNDERLEEAIDRTGARLVILDPIQAYVGSNVDLNRANEIRPVLKQLGNVAERHNCAIVLIGHMNKSSNSKSTYRGLGSIDFQATARSVLIVGRLRDKPSIRIIGHDKSSLAQEGKPMAFEIDEEGFKWIGEYDISMEDILSGTGTESKMKLAEDLLKDMLKDGEKSQIEILEKSNLIGVSKRVLDEAKKSLEVVSVKKGKSWYWKLNM